MSVPAAYIVVILVWSTTPLGVKWSSQGMSPVAGAFGRVLLAAALGWVLARLWQIAVPWHRQAVRIYAFSNIGVFVGLLCVYFGAQYMPSGLISILYGLAPVMSALLSRFLLDEPPFSLSKWLAMALGLAGLMVVFRHEIVLLNGNFLGFALVLFSVFCFCLSGVLIKREGPVVHPLAQTVGTLMMATPLYGAVAAVVGLQIQSLEPRAIGAILYLALFGSFIGFFCYFYVLKHLPASTVALTTLVTPVLALSLGSALNGEAITPTLVTGAAMIGSGLLLYYWGDQWLARLSPQRAG
ncbi:MAG TPA: DMT family transporter [Dongiaceae bacterium]|nr:DMT family transporter [Dongiaceae bacterium]